MPENYCEIHDCEMRRYEKGGDSWHSHRTDDPKYPKGWCNGKPPKGSTGLVEQVRKGDALKTLGGDEMTLERLGKGLKKVLEVVEDNNRILRAIHIVNVGKREDVEEVE